MKKIFLFCAVITAAAFFTACEEECEKNNTGDITIYNNTEKALWFDVTRPDGYTNENRYISAGSGTTYTMTSGPVKVWGSLTSINADFILLQEMILSQCAEESYYTVSQTCSMFDLTKIEVVNSTGFSIVIDVWVTDVGFLGEKTLSNGSSHTYNDIPATSAQFWAKPLGGDWHYGSFYNLNDCVTLRHTWTSSKLNEAEFGDKFSFYTEFE